jgi:hypothetical protein
MSWRYETRLINGTVLQKLPEGLLVSGGDGDLADVGVTHYDSPRGRWDGGGSTNELCEVKGDKPGCVCMGVVLLVDFSNYSKVLDGEKIEVMGLRANDVLCAGHAPVSERDRRAFWYGKCSNTGGSYVKPQIASGRLPIDSARLLFRPRQHRGNRER